MEKKNTKMKIFIVILCLVVIALTGYIIYDKVINNNNENNSNDNMITFLEKVEGVWGSNDNILKIRNNNDEYYFVLGKYGTDFGISGYIKKVTEINENEYKLEIFSEGCKGYDCMEEKDDETLYETIKLDSKKNIIINYNNEYQFITKDFSNDILIDNFFN